MIRLGANEITGVSINKESNQAVYIQWADVNQTVPQYRVIIWYNGTIVADSILEGTWTSWTVDRGTYALMPGDVIKATVTPYANNAAVGPSYSATAVIQSTPQAQEPTAVQQVTPVSQPPVVQTPTTQPPTPVQTVPTAPPSTQTPNQQVSQPPADTTSGTSVPSTSTFDLFSWVKSHTLLSVGILAGTGLAIYGANKK